ncbi:hypothetical protein [Sphingobacterium thalpophilum]|uniref:hypothetical protein n=1 Tax=Sphingobacterium thalpophilum TaxID=259 RepID=UPI002D79B1C6|nr:hypothetical protein [Sphingobacterium thalpophilum]
MMRILSFNKEVTFFLFTRRQEQEAIKPQSPCGTCNPFLCQGQHKPRSGCKRYFVVLIPLAQRHPVGKEPASSHLHRPGKFTHRGGKVKGILTHQSPAFLNPVRP